jgi:hypothetical protein
MLCIKEATPQNCALHLWRRCACVLHAARAINVQQSAIIGADSSCSKISQF